MERTIEEWIAVMRRCHPKVGGNFEIGVMMYNNGYDRPYDRYRGRMGEGKQLLQLGWDMARRDARINHHPQPETKK